MKNTMNTKLVKTLIIMLTALLIITGCSSSNNNANSSNSTNSGGSTSTPDTNSDADTKVIESKNLQVKLNVPKGWVEDSELNSQAIIGVSERKNEKYAMVSSISKSDFADDSTLDDYKSLYIETTKTAIQGFSDSDEEEITIDSVPAKLFEVTGEVQKVKIHYLIGLFEKDDAFYQVVTWTTQSKFKENRDELLGVIKSLTVLKGMPQPSASAPSPEASDSAKKTKMTSDDKKLEITIPAYMTKEIELSPLAQIQASRTQHEDYLMVISEEKGQFSEDFTLEDFYSAVIGNMKGSLTNSSQTEPKEIQVNGKPALQLELNGEIDKVKISYLITLVNTDNTFSQVLFWTLQNRMDEKRDVFIEAASTFTEVSGKA